MLLVLAVSCNQNAKPQDGIPEQTTAKAETASTSDNRYEFLFAMEPACKLSREEFATLFGFSTEQMERQIESSYCGFNIIYKDGNSGWFNIKVVDFPKEEIISEIQKIKADSKQGKGLIAMEGQNLIYKQPARPNWQLFNPNYDNKIIITYHALLASELSKDQKMSLKEKGMQVAAFLIAKFENYDQ